MRSVLKNHVDEFLEILRYDKNDWYDVFWKSYRKRYGPIVPNYENLHSLDEERIKEILMRMERREIDRLKRYWQGMKPADKRKLSRELRMRSELLELSKADFVVFLFGGLGISDYDFVDGKSEKVILVDIVKIWHDRNIDRLPEKVLRAVMDFRGLGGERNVDRRGEKIP